MLDVSAQGHVTDILARCLSRYGVLSDADKSALAAAPFAVRQLAGDHNLLREGDAPACAHFMLDGFACASKTLETGQRQIIGFYVPFDLSGLSNVLLGALDCSFTTLTTAMVAVIPRATILGWIDRQPGLACLIWRASLVESAMVREWVMNVGRRTAYQRTAHLLCEIVARMRAVGLADGDDYHMPITQMELADALGLTPVHVNRTLQWLRGDGLIRLSGGTLTVPDWAELRQAGGFDPAYLHDLAA